MICHKDAACVRSAVALNYKTVTQRLNVVLERAGYSFSGNANSGSGSSVVTIKSAFISLVASPNALLPFDDCQLSKQKESSVRRIKKVFRSFAMSDW